MCESTFGGANLFACVPIGAGGILSPTEKVDGVHSHDADGKVHTDHAGLRGLTASGYNYLVTCNVATEVVECGPSPGVLIETEAKTV